ncbi:F-box/LRR-repeat protein At3g03360-like [Coffea eugenioides]|uniref:F-box/LRR-repeat protein At3g03360-like n=1 Tax=Coffea eugenioides TaxID=49369 RepID=UPI000F60C100|nr:F-box/LRR-repeat protein At3g03360-like [Coffea eugenioides]
MYNQLTGEDQISQLPDDILASILSWLTLKEAILTSLLSTRWRYLWTHITRLDFHLPRKEETNGKRDRGHLSQNEKLRHVNRVNRVLDLHRSHFLEKFRIALPLDREGYHCELDKWIKFVLSRKVRALEIDLTEPSRRRRRRRRRNHRIQQYTLPLNWTSNSSSFSASFFNALKSLSLKFVGVDDQMAKSFLSSCPMLEHLSIQGSSQLKNLQITGPSLKLKKLEIRDIVKISIQLCNVEHLESFTSRDTRCEEWVLENVPSLVHIDVDPLIMCSGIPDFITRMSERLLNQLVELNLKIPQLDVETVFERYYSKFPKMEKLRVLKLDVLSTSESILLSFAALFNASPYLRKFVMQIEWAPYESMTDANRLTAFQYACCPANEHLKTVKFGGYSHRLSEFEFAVHLLTYAVALEEFIVDTRISEDSNKRHPKHRLRRQFERVTPQGVKLVIL